MPIRAIICDLFDVLFFAKNLAAHQSLEKRLGLPENGLTQAMLRSPQFREAIWGRISGEELWRAVALDIGLEAQEWSMVADTFYSAIDLNTELLAFLRELRPRYKTAILSNAPSDVRALVTQRFHLEHEVDEVIISAEVGATKPHPEIYQLAVHRLGVQVQEALFIDDELRFVEAARAVGMQGVQFENTEQAIAEIRSCLLS
jgi:HAD superfamily hydrolase (TIGR01509 family)